MTTFNYDPTVPVQYVPITPLTVPVTATMFSVITGDVLLCGWSFKETTGSAPATVLILDGADTTGQRLIDITLLAGQSRYDDAPFPGIYCTRGVFINIGSGSVQGTIFVRDV